MAQMLPHTERTRLGTARLRACAVPCMSSRSGHGARRAQGPSRSGLFRAVMRVGGLHARTPSPSPGTRGADYANKQMRTCTAVAHSPRLHKRKCPLPHCKRALQARPNATPFHFSAAPARHPRAGPRRRFRIENAARRERPRRGTIAARRSATPAIRRAVPRSARGLLARGGLRRRGYAVALTALAERYAKHCARSAAGRGGRGACGRVRLRHTQCGALEHAMAPGCAGCTSALRPALPPVVQASGSTWRRGGGLQSTGF